MVRGTIAVTLGFICALLVAAPASAGRHWCRSDPVFDIEGTRIQVLVGIPAETMSLVNGPIQVDVYTPPGAARQVVSTDLGFNNFGESVRFNDTQYQLGKLVPIKIRVQVPIAKIGLKAGQAIPIELTVIAAGQPPIVVYGTARQAQITLTVPRAAVEVTT